MSIGLVVNSYERTYRTVLAPGFFPSIAKSNLREFDETVALINNVDDPLDARDRAESLVANGEITSYAFVADHIGTALEAAHLSPRALRVRPFLLDYGLVMPHVVRTDWLLGWDAETSLTSAANWVDPSIRLMKEDSRIFHTAVAWPPARAQDAGVEGDAIATTGDFALSWGFSDQLFLLRRSALLGRRFSTFSPAAIARHAPHPYTFEFRVESYQRARRKLRATLTTVSYETNLSVAGVLQRTGGTSRAQRYRIEALHQFEHLVTRRLPASLPPRIARNAGLEQARW